jgi:aspartate/methionine/tyrosine aminotransferase
MNIPIFELERVQSVYENQVDYNLTESGFHPYKISELLSNKQLDNLNNLVLGYGQTNGSIELRETISKMYTGVDFNNVLVTNGSSEANYVACHTILSKGDEVVMMVPNYMQIWGIVREIGCIPLEFHLREENGWKPDLEELRSLVNQNTKMIVVCNPNNPTAYILSDAEMEEIVNIASSVDSWILSDEVYRGAELNNIITPSFMGMYDKVLANGGLSKAYALPGLRMGWLVGSKSIIENAWAYHDYTSITAGIISNYIGEIALEAGKRMEILDRNRNMLRENLSVVKEWLAPYGDKFEYHDPMGGGMLYIKYNFDINSTELATWLREEKSVFILAGDCFGMDKYIRIGIGAEKEYILEGLARIKEALEERFPELGTH